MGRIAGFATTSAIYSRLAVQAKISLIETGAQSHAQAHISTQPPPPREDAWFSRADEDQERRRRAEPPPRGRPQACQRKRRIPRLAFVFDGRSCMSP